MAEMWPASCRRERSSGARSWLISKSGELRRTSICTSFLRLLGIVKLGSTMVIHPRGRLGVRDGRRKFSTRNCRTRCGSPKGKVLSQASGMDAKHRLSSPFSRPPLRRPSSDTPPPRGARGEAARMRPSIDHVSQHTWRHNRGRGNRWPSGAAPGASRQGSFTTGALEVKRPRRPRATGRRRLTQGPRRPARPSFQRTTRSGLRSVARKCP